MAIYHFSGTSISRGQGRSAIAAAAYRSASKLVDERHGVIYDYTKKQDVVHAEIFLPENAPEELKNREVLWNTVERFEKRKDAQLAREFTISLPRELSIEQNKQLIREFVKTEFVSLGMIADVCLHNDLMPDGERQPHAHVMLTLREVGKEGFGLKVRAWNEKSNLLLWREAWANAANHHLALHGYDQQIDHRSFKDQGIELEPQYKIGAKVASDRLARLEDHQRIARENGNRLFEKPEIALDAITRQQSTFSLQDVARFVSRHTDSAEQFQQVFEKVKASPELVYLGVDAQGKARFSTQDMLGVESSMMRKADVLDKRTQHCVSAQAIKGAIDSRTLSLEQETALQYVTSPGDLKSIVGYAGTGKSYLLGAAREAWDASGYRVQGVALSGVAARNLSDSSGISSRTIASLFYRLDKGMLQFNARDILVVDEAGMLGSRTMERLTREVEGAGAKLVLVGDWQQLQAIDAGAPFRAIAENYQYVELNTIRRQTTPWQIQASLDLALGHVDKALDAYQEHHHVHTFNYQQEAKTMLISQWNDVRMTHTNESQIILAYTRKEVQELNHMARVQKRGDGELGDDVLFLMEHGERNFATNDRVYFLKREDSLSVINGTLGTIRSINEKTRVMRIELDKEDLNKKPWIVQVNTDHYKHLEHGYAATVYKAQGVTVDRTYILPSKYYDAHSTYVAMTRHRKSCDIFVSREAFKHDRQLITTLKRNRAKEVTLDYTQMDKEFARQRTISTEKVKHARQTPERYPSQSMTEALSHRVDALENRNLRTQLKEFEQAFRRENPELAMMLDNSILSKIARQTKDFIETYTQLSKGQDSMKRSSAQQNQLTRFAEKALQEPKLLSSLKHASPELSSQVEQLIKTQRNSIERSLIKDKERDF
jgi:Ti-type conjugative transfer relaxase TraA